MRMPSITETVAVDHREALQRRAIVRALRLEAKRSETGRSLAANFDGKLTQEVSFPSKFGAGGEGREITGCIVGFGG